MIRIHNNLQTSCGGPKSRISCLAVGIIFTLTLSSGSITSLKTLSCPSTTTSWSNQQDKKWQTWMGRRMLDTHWRGSIWWWMCWSTKKGYDIAHLPPEGVQKSISILLICDGQKSLLCFCSNWATSTVMMIVVNWIVTITTTQGCKKIDLTSYNKYIICNKIPTKRWFFLVKDQSWLKVIWRVLTILLVEG